MADLYDYGNFEYQGWAGQHPKPWPVPRLHTPEREEACLVEGRFGVAGLHAARARFDDVYERCGKGWVEAVCVDGRRWIRVAVWTAAPDRILVEASSREAYAAVVALLESLEPPARRRAPSGPTATAPGRSGVSTAARCGRGAPTRGRTRPSSSWSSGRSAGGSTPRPGSSTACRRGRPWATRTPCTPSTNCSNGRRRGGAMRRACSRRSISTASASPLGSGAAGSGGPLQRGGAA